MFVFPAIIESLLKQEVTTSEHPHRERDYLKSSFGKGLPVNQNYHLASYFSKPLLVKRYSCSKCNQSFSYPGNLSRHRKACEGNFDIKCMYCEKVFYRQDVLKVHMRSKHGIISL